MNSLDLDGRINQIRTSTMLDVGGGRVNRSVPLTSEAKREIRQIVADAVAYVIPPEDMTPSLARHIAGKTTIEIEVRAKGFNSCRKEALRRKKELGL